MYFASCSVPVGCIFYINMGTFPSRCCLGEEPDCSVALGLPERSCFTPEERSQQNCV